MRNRVSCTSAGCKHCLPTNEKLSQVRCRNKKKTNEVVFCCVCTTKSRFSGDFRECVGR